MSPRHSLLHSKLTTQFGKTKSTTGKETRGSGYSEHGYLFIYLFTLFAQTVQAESEAECAQYD